MGSKINIVKVCVATSLLPLWRDFSREHELVHELVSQPEKANLKILQVDKSRFARGNTLYAKGLITCCCAQNLAKKLGLSLKQMGVLINALKIKIRACQLGCFS
jgi:hypothetical protein